MKRIAYFNGSIGNYDEMTVPFADRSVFYGDAIYDAVLVLEIGNERPFFEAAFPEMLVYWLDTSVGEDAVLLVTRQELLAQARRTAQ